VLTLNIARAFLAERQRVVVCAGAAGQRMLPRCDLKEAAPRWRRFDCLQDARRLGWIASAALAGRRPERVAVTGLLSAGFWYRPRDCSDQVEAIFPSVYAKCKMQDEFFQTPEQVDGRCGSRASAGPTLSRESLSNVNTESKRSKCGTFSSDDAECKVQHVFFSHHGCHSC